MKQNEQQYKIAVETQWNIYSNPYVDYHKVYSAYTKLIKYIEKGIVIGYKWIKDFIIDKTQKVKNRIRRISEGNAFYDIHRAAKWFYLMYYYDFNGNFLFSKVGTTERTLYKRADEHEKNYTGTYKNVWTVKIIKGWDCGKINPKHVELDMIDYLAECYPNTHVPNDRFNIVIDPDIIDEKINTWLPVYGMIH